MYIYQLDKWPNFTFNKPKLTELLAEVRYMQGKLLGKMNNLGFELREEATLKILTQDVIKSSEIEGEKLPYQEVRSSIARRMGIDIGGLQKADRNVEGIVEVMIDATKNYNMPLSKERLFSWHCALFPTGRSGMHKIIVGSLRGKESGVMQVISGPFGKERVHFEAPTYKTLEKEMKRFIQWFNSDTEIDGVIKAAIGHFWFVTIHPFDDGNGRIARALSDMILAKCENSSQRFYSMSSQIQNERTSYYDVLEKAQKGNLDITDWIEWFLKCFKTAILESDVLLENILLKARFWEIYKLTNFNERQKLMVNHLLDGFEGKLTSSKWAKICKCSQDSAIRDIKDLIEKGVLLKDISSGRSTAYLLQIRNKI